MIEIKNLDKSYGNKKVLSGISLRFEPGRVYGLVGENGAGKTTLFRCMAGLEPYRGTITAAHHPLKNHLGLLLTEPFFFSRMTGMEYIRLLCQARGVNPGNVTQRNVFDLPLYDYVSSYSTGMKKKLGILGILLQENHYFILDEPFNGVDIQSNILITAIVQELKKLGKTVLISSHIFSTLRDTCDEMHVLQAGKIIQTARQHDFDSLEREMKKNVLGDRLEGLKLQ